MSVPEKLAFPNSFDFDGVITIGLCPRPGDYVITGRGHDEGDIVRGFIRDHFGGDLLEDLTVMLNPITKDMGRTREDSGRHKAASLMDLILVQGVQLGVIFEDDPIQFTIIGAMLNSIEKVNSHSPDPILRIPKLCFIGSDWTHK